METTKSDRIALLGFTPQKDDRYSAHLPYSQELDVESVAIFADIKANLSRSIQLRDIKIGCRHWIVQLERYILIYGYKFSKTDHVLLVKMVFELLTMPLKEYALVEKFAVVLALLLKKRSLLSREDLILPWRPLYNIVEDLNKNGGGCRVFPLKFDTNLKNAVRACSPYFHEDATQEMLDEWRPWLCPFDMLVIAGLQCLELFLPTSLPPELHNKGFRLWFDEFLELWKSFHSMPSWEGSLVNLFSRLAHDNIGFIDWTPNIPMIFTRLLRSFCLPVGTKQLMPNRNQNAYDIVNTSIWIVSMMGGPDDCVQEHITKLFKALHSFFHPSNMGKWTLRLGSFLHNLPKMFVRRLRRERYKALSWLPPIPDSHKLTDAQITEFVESLKSSVFVAMFSKFGSQEASMALRNLATLRPEIIAPPLLEKMYPAMETLIEPHRLIACMICIVSVVRPMLTSPKYYPEGPSHVLPLLKLALPGIDANDFKKTLVTLQMVSTFVTLIPIVDCSDANFTVQGLTEHEKDLCSATAQFEDFVLSFLDRIHNLIENSSQETTSAGAIERQTPEQSVLEVGLASTVSAMLQQCSTAIFMSALRKIREFVFSNVFEVKVSGKLTAHLVRAAIRTKPAIGLKMFIPHLCSNILVFLQDHPAAYDEQFLDNTFLWNLIILSHAVRCDGAALLPYKTQLLEVLYSVLKLKSVFGFEVSGQFLKHFLRGLTHLYPLSLRSVDEDFDKPFTEYMPIKDWGRPGDLDSLNVQWHIPSSDELDLAQEIVDTVLLPELEFFHSFSSTHEISKEDLLRRLNIVAELLLGAGSYFPPWEEEQVILKKSQVPLIKFRCHVKTDDRVLTAKGQNVRVAVHDAMSHLLKCMNISREDDTRSLFHIVKIYEVIIQHYGAVKSEFDGRWKSFHVVKSALENQLVAKKRHLRALLIDRIQLQHELRILNSCCHGFTSRHQVMLNELLNLSLSRYREVRKRAQMCLHHGFRLFNYSYLTCLPQIVDHLKNKDVEQHVFKGSLYVIQSGGKTCLANKRDWQSLSKIWPAIVQAQQFEKPSILRVIEDIMNKIFKGLETFSVTITTTDSAIAAATGLISGGTAPLPSTQAASEVELLAAVDYEKAANETALENYNCLTEELLNLVESGKLTWKFSQIGLEFLSLLLHEDIQPSARYVSLFAKSTISDLLYIRKLSFNTVTTVLELQKRKPKKIPVDIEKAAGVGHIDMTKLAPGDRDDNKWLQFDPAHFISSEEEWNKVVFIEKTHWGYYTWPKELKTYAPYSEQPKLDRTREELSEAERPLYDSFMSDEFVAKIFEFLALEEEKSTDKFRQSVLKYFKNLFRNYGDMFLPKFKPHIERLIKDTSHDKHASSQRCSMEVLAGIIGGSKLWPYPKLENLWTWIVTLLEAASTNFTVETVSDWGNFFLFVCENRDPRKLQWLYRLLLKNPLNGEGGAFGDSARLFVLQQAILQQEWRIPEYLHSVVNYLRPHMAHNYKNVRDRIGSLLSSCLHIDYKVTAQSVTRSPKREDIIKSVLPELEQFRDFVKPADEGSSTSEAMEVDTFASDDSEEKKTAVRLCKTVVQCVSTCFLRSLSPCPKEVFQLLPIIENLQCEANDEDLREDCKNVMLNLSHVLVPEDSIAVALRTIKEVAGLKSWHARANILNYMQQMVFGNFFLLQSEHHRRTIQTMLLHLLCDEQLEVREMAAVTLSGMIHCNYLELDKDMLDHFERLRSTKVKIRRNMTPLEPVSLQRLIQRHAGVLGLSACVQAYPYDVPEFIPQDHFERLRSTKVKIRRNMTPLEPVSLQRLIQRHAGVLGLSACVQAYPYDVPEFIPQVLVDLSVHVNDPQPIGTTVTKTLSNFRRTHHDNWHDHKRMFTDDQLVTLTDLLISPNYYA